MMESAILLLLAVLIGLSVGVGAGFYGRRLITARRIDSARVEADRIIDASRGEARAIVIEAKDQALTDRDEMESEMREQRGELKKLERRLRNRDDNLDKRANNLERRERKFSQTEQRAQKLRDEIEDRRQQALAKLEEISELSLSQAKDLLMREAEEEMQYEIARRYRDIEVQAREDASVVSTRILATSIQRMASDVVSEMTVASVPLPNDDMKGRLIGREGRNIRSI